MKRTKHIYKRFVSLSIGQSFYLTLKKLAVKTGFVSCREITAKPTEHRIAPWRRVRTTTPVKSRRITANECYPNPGFHQAYEETATQKMMRERDEATRAAGQTHYVGDDCPGGHAEIITHPDNPVFCRDPMVQDHTPQPQPEYERTL